MLRKRHSTRYRTLCEGYSLWTRYRRLRERYSSRI